MVHTKEGAMSNDVLSLVCNRERLASLRSLNLLDTPATEAFDRLARLAARILRAPVVFTSLVDENRQFFKSCLGLPEPWASWREAPLSHSFCQHVVAANQPLVINDARIHPLLRTNPAIRDLKIVAYLGVPLTMPDGQTIGSFCVTDSVPRVWSPMDIDTVRDFAASVMSEIELHALRSRLEARIAQQVAELDRSGLRLDASHAEVRAGHKRTEAALQENEQRLRLALRAGQMGIYDWDLMNDAIVWSEEHAHLFGMKPGDFDGRYQTFAQRVHPDDLPRIDRAVEAARTGRRLFQEEFRIVWPDGTLHWVAGQGRFFYDGDGRALRMTGVVRDIDARKHMEIILSGEKRVLEMTAEGAALSEILEAIARHLEALSGDTLCSILLLDTDGVHLRHGAAPSLPQAYNRAIAEVAIGPRVGSCGTAAYRNQPVIVTDIGTDPLWTDYRALALSHGLRACWSMPIRSGDGRVLGTFALYYRETRTPGPADFELIERSTHLAGIAIARKHAEAALHDLTHKLEHRVAERTAELAETNAELEAFSYTVSHDLRAPLRAVQGLAQALQEDYADALDIVGRDYTQRLITAAERMDRLILDLLAYSRLARAEITAEAVDLGAVVQRAREQLATDIAKCKATIKVKKSLPTIVAHPATLLQVVTNLIANAIKFVAPGVRPEVNIRSEQRGHGVRLWVEDNGIGIEPEHQERIFRVFERLHGIENYPGTGIGLAIIRKGMERMNGTTGVESAFGQGSRFWIELPHDRSNTHR